MTAHTTTTPAELADRTTLAVALAMFIMALIFAIGVAEFFSPEGLATVLSITEKALAALVVFLVLSTYFLKFRRLEEAERRAYLADDGFLQSSFRRALSKSWMVVFVLLALLQALDKLVLDHLPAMPVEVVLQSVLSAMLIVFSIAFGASLGTPGGEEAGFGQ